jgi:hypothetical protein
MGEGVRQGVLGKKHPLFLSFWMWLFLGWVFLVAVDLCWFPEVLQGSYFSQFLVVHLMSSWGSKCLRLPSLPSCWRHSPVPESYSLNNTSSRRWLWSQTGQSKDKAGRWQESGWIGWGGSKDLGILSWRFGLHELTDTVAMPTKASKTRQRPGKPTWASSSVVENVTEPKGKENLQWFHFTSHQGLSPKSGGRVT